VPAEDASTPDASAADGSAQEAPAAAPDPVDEQPASQPVDQSVEGAARRPEPVPYVDAADSSPFEIDEVEALPDPSTGSDRTG
jgi:hypothetical protein